MAPGYGVVTISVADVEDDCSKGWDSSCAVSVDAALPETNSLRHEHEIGGIEVESEDVFFEEIVARFMIDCATVGNDVSRGRLSEGLPNSLDGQETNGNVRLISGIGEARQIDALPFSGHRELENLALDFRGKLCPTSASCALLLIGSKKLLSKTMPANGDV